MKQGLTENQYVQLAKEAFYKLIKDIPFVSDVEFTNTGHQLEFGNFCANVHFTDSKTDQVFRVEVRSNGEKRFANLFSVVAKQHKDNACYVFMAPYISEATGEFLKGNKLSYLDLSGNCYILTRRIIIYISGKPNQYIEKREKKNYFSKSSSAVSSIIRTMLNEPDKNWKVKELAETTGKAIGTVSNVKAFLTERDWIDDLAYSFRLKNISELLYTWSKEYHKKESIVKEFYSLLPVPEIEAEISAWGQKHEKSAVLGGFSAAARYAPTVRYNRVNAYVDEQVLLEFEKDLGLKAVPSGGNVVVTIPHDETPCMFSRLINGSVVTSPAQTVLDLLAVSGRGEEAANAVILKFYSR